MSAPLIFWFRRDLRLDDHPGLSAAVALGRPIIPVFIRDPLIDGLGAAPKWRLGLGVDAFGAALERAGSALILRSGEAYTVLRELAQQTGARDIWWSRCLDRDAITRDTALKAALTKDGIGTRSFEGHVLFDPWTVQTKTGGFYRVYTPFWRAVQARDPGRALPAISKIPAPQYWPASERLADWKMGAAMNRGADIVARFAQVGAAAAQTRLAAFLDGPIETYSVDRDLPGVSGTSRLSENLAYGEISPRRLWWAGQTALARGAAGAENFLKELVWREFAYHLCYHTPHILTANWRSEWDRFPWSHKRDTPEVQAWQRGITGFEFVDAAMRELYTTGYMHNRARMIVASVLCKHLLCHWKIGLDWFAECLIDWDPAANAMGWQWSAGSGPDASPYFRVFNPVTQAEKFDPQRIYRTRWIAQASERPTQTALLYFDAIPGQWKMKPSDRYPAPIISASAGRERALAAYKNSRET